MSKPTNKIEPQKWMRSRFLKQVIETLGDARVVGGCVRDAILKRPIKDIDVATPRTPEQVIKLLENVGLKVVPTGLKHGTVTAVHGTHTIEITTLRRDLDCDGRHAEIEFTSDWEEDAARRDFTMNALSMDLEGNVYDYFNGISDLHKGIIKFVGNPNERVQEDYLRILRYFRFEAHYGTHAIDKPSLTACIKYKKNIESLSGERIQAEMLKLLSSKDPSHVLTIMAHEGILEHVIPGIKAKLDLDPIRHLILIEREEGSVIPSNDSIIRLALLLEGGEKQVEALCERWRCSKAHKKQLLELVEPVIEIKPTMDEKLVKKQLAKFGKESFVRQLLYHWAKDEGNDHIFACKSMLALANTWDIPQFPLKGKDILSVGIDSGKRVGELLEKSYQIWEESDYKISKAKLLTLIKKNLL